ncbi:hypothetical protein EC847_106181 [Scandinavium goeteborgense]|uniref:Uncharacterized protein n=1 Tax=Scandinavium goeteborgense TaxID=1851514 RepID=A0A4R6EK85_SCAGO|nr:hypothetical protein EC847_106181 [Scandinavium goeteborgense]
MICAFLLTIFTGWLHLRSETHLMLNKKGFYVALGDV